MDFTQRLDSLEAWVEALLQEHQDQTLDQGQQPQQAGRQGYQQVQQQPCLPQPMTFSKADQDAFRRAVYQELHGLEPQVRQQIQQGMQKYIQQYQAPGQQHGQQLYYDVHNQQAQQQQAQQQQAQQQQAHQRQVQQQQAQQQQAHRQQLPPRRHQPQHQPQGQTQPRLDQPQSERNQKKGPTFFSTTKADYVIVTRIADSSEGTVSLARSTSRGSSPSTKELRIVKSIRSNGLIPREAHMLRTAGSHPNVLKIFESAYNELWGLAHMCMEFCSGGDLYELQCYYGTQHMHVPRAILFQAIINVSDGLAFLHGGWVRDEKTGIYEKKTANVDHIIHRDLKSTNIFIRPNVQGKLPTFVLGDFGQAFHSSEAQYRSGGGTRGFRAPEFSKRPEVQITYKADVYSFGMTFVSICQNFVMASEKFVCGSHPAGMHLPGHLQAYTLERLLRGCLEEDPRHRPEMSPSGVLAYANGYRTLLKSMNGYVHLPPRLRAANVEVARAA